MDKYINKIKKKTLKHTEYINNNSNKIDNLNIFLENSDILVKEISINNNNRKYKSDYRKKLISKFDNIKNKNILIDIYNIIINDIGTNYSSNRNGIFINMNILSDTCIDKLNEYIENNLNNNLSDIKSDKLDCKIYKLDEIELLSEIGHKLSNQEKNIIKRIRKHT